MKNLFSNRKKTPTVLQMEVTECGAASLGMILAYYGKYIPLEQLRSDCGVTRNGSKASLIVKAAKSYGLEAKGFRVLADQLDSFDAPMILFWNFNHFLVYEGHSRNKKYYYLNDPAVGPLTVDRETFEKSYTGVALTFAPGENFRKSGSKFSIWSALFPMVRGMKSTMGIIIWGGLLLVLPGVLIPGMMQFFVDQILPGKSGLLVPLLVLLIITMLLQALLSCIVSYALNRGKLQLAVNKTLGMLNYLFTLPSEFFSQRSSGDLQNRVLLNSTVVNSIFGTVADNVVKLFTALFFLFLMFQYSWLLSCFAIGFLLLDLLFLRIAAKRKQIHYLSLQMLNMKMLSSVINGICMIENIRASGREKAVFQQWSGQLAEVSRKNLEVQTGAAYFNIPPTFFNLLANVLTLCVGAKLVMDGDLTLGGLFAFQTLTASFSTPVTALLQQNAELQSLRADVERIQDIYKYEPEKCFAETSDGTDKMCDQLEFEMRNITFGYSKHEEPLIKDFSLKIAPGKRIALVGHSGSGKSTIAKLANGTLSPWRGEILLNGKPLSCYTKEEYYSLIGTVDQNIMLFSGTVGENLTLFAPLYDASILQRAVRDAAIEEELTARGDMLKQIVDENGRNFSGGQCQRLEIARTLAQQTPMLILDEATSALDPVTELQIDSAIRKRQVSCLIIAHRLSTVRDCDEIIMLENGIVLERGTHQELMQFNGAYAHMMNLEQGGALC